jgi:peptidoglycan/LPS O-acetylase OafA/YrhL
MVVLTHVTYEFSGPVVAAIFKQGGVGVSFFFVLSGFVLTWSRKNGQRKRDFYRNRFARVYPLHLITWALTLGLITLTATATSWPVALACLLLVQAWIPDSSYYFGVNGPSWSLSDEAFFYAVFPFLAPVLLKARLATLVKTAAGLYMAVAAVTLAGSIVHTSIPLADMFYSWPLYRVWEFILGIVLATAVKGGWRSPLRLGAAAALSAAAFAGVTALNIGLTNRVGPLGVLPIHSFPPYFASLVMTPCFVLLIAAAARSDLDGRKTHLRSRAFVTLGQWSFALYLSHLLLVDSLKLVIPGDLPWFASWPVVIGVVAVSIALSAALYRLVELPLESRLRAPRSGARLD